MTWDKEWLANVADEAIEIVERSAGRITKRELEYKLVSLFQRELHDNMDLILRVLAEANYVKYRGGSIESRMGSQMR